MRQIVSCFIAAMLALPIDGLAQSTSTNNWTAVTTIPSGEKLVIDLRNGKKVNGEFGNASETTVTVVRGTNTEDINRSDIRKIYREIGVSARKGTLIGTAIGGGTGAVLGAATGGSGSSFSFGRGAVAVFLGIAGASVGAITGFVVGKLRQKKVLIYEAT